MSDRNDASRDGELRILARKLGLADDDPEVLRNLQALQQGGATPPHKSPPPGWYPDPDDQERTRYWDGEEWTQRHDIGEESRPTKSDLQLGIGLGFVGAAVLLISVFLPMAESTEFAKVVDNTMIQTGAEGWGVVVLALAGAAATYRRMNGEGKAWPLIVIGVLGAGLAFYIANSDALTLTSASSTEGLGLSEALKAMSQTEKASPGIGIYALGLGGLLTLIAGYLLRTKE